MPPGAEPTASDLRDPSWTVGPNRMLWLCQHGGWEAARDALSDIPGGMEDSGLTNQILAGLITLEGRAWENVKEEMSVRRLALSYDHPGQRLPPWPQAWAVLRARVKMSVGVDLGRGYG